MSVDLLFTPPKEPDIYTVIVMVLHGDGTLSRREHQVPKEQIPWPIRRRNDPAWQRLLNDKEPHDEP